MYNQITKNTVMERLADGAYLITPNNRLSAALTETYFHHKKKKVINKPHCMPLKPFLKGLFQKVLNDAVSDPPLVLSSYQCRHLWQQVLKSQTNLNYSKGLLNTVIDTWRNSVQWQLTAHEDLFASTPQCWQFQYWWQDFNYRLAALNAIPEEQLIDYLIASNKPFINNDIVWACFDAFTPQLKALQDYFTHHGLEQSVYDLDNRVTVNYQYAARDHQEELNQVIEWLQQQRALDQQKIAVVVPDLQQSSLTIQRQLKRHFTDNEFNISLGLPLNEYPLVSHALNWIALEPKNIDYHQARLLLHSPYLKGSKDEFRNRAQIIEDSPLIQETVITERQWQTMLAFKAPVLADCLSALNNYPETATPAQWIAIFCQRLNHLGFPGDYSLSSENYQCYHRFIELFDTFRELTLLSPTLSATEAVNTLSDLAQLTIFQPQSSTKPIHILGLLEASGCEFDSIWIMGLTDQCLPQKTRLSPFIPHYLQRQLNMPHSSPERELEFSQNLIQRFQRASALTIFSYPEMTGDTPNIVSPLISDLPTLTTAFCVPDETNPSELIAIEDNYIIPLPSTKNISGGTTLLANQAKCPFRAFAAHRLNAKTNKTLKDGLDQLERGQIIHKVMENIWRRIENQQTLLAFSEEELKRCVQAAILQAMEFFHLNNNDSFPAFIQTIEYNRLEKLVCRSLEWEKERSPFSVESIEEEFCLRIGHINFKIRVDRLDQVEDNKKWIIDYKTTLPPGRPWQEERPKEPQILLYALLDEAINTLMFIQLKGGQVVSKSFGEHKLHTGKHNTLRENELMTDYKKKWQQQLESLADEYVRGYCPPKPSTQAICTQCEYQSLCRFNLKQ